MLCKLLKCYKCIVVSKIRLCAYSSSNPASVVIFSGLILGFRRKPVDILISLFVQIRAFVVFNLWPAVFCLLKQNFILYIDNLKDSNIWFSFSLILWSEVIVMLWVKFSLSTCWFIKWGHTWGKSFIFFLTMFSPLLIFSFPLVNCDKGGFSNLLNYFWFSYPLLPRGRLRQRNKSQVESRVWHQS